MTIPDTSLNDHPAVRWLMTQPEWPTHAMLGALKYSTGPSLEGWYFGDIGGAHSWQDDVMALSAITLAAVEALWAKDYEIKRLTTNGAAIFAYRKWSMPRDANYAGQQYATGSNQLLATLAAVEAVCMEKA